MGTGRAQEQTSWVLRETELNGQEQGDTMAEPGSLRQLVVRFGVGLHCQNQGRFRCTLVECRVRWRHSISSLLSKGKTRARALLTDQLTEAVDTKCRLRLVRTDGGLRAYSEYLGGLSPSPDLVITSADTAPPHGDENSCVWNILTRTSRRSLAPPLSSLPRDRAAPFASGRLVRCRLQGSGRRAGWMIWHHTVISLCCEPAYTLILHKLRLCQGSESDSQVATFACIQLARKGVAVPHVHLPNTYAYRLSHVFTLSID